MEETAESRRGIEPDGRKEVSRMTIRLKRLILVSSVASGILVGSLFFPRAAFAPHVEKGDYKGKKTKDKDYTKKKSAKEVVYVRCPHCGKKIKIHVGKP